MVNLFKVLSIVVAVAAVTLMAVALATYWVKPDLRAEMNTAAMSKYSLNYPAGKHRSGLSRVASQQIQHRQETEEQFPEIHSAVVTTLCWLPTGICRRICVHRRRHSKKKLRL